MLITITGIAAVAQYNQPSSLWRSHAATIDMVFTMERDRAIIILTVDAVPQGLGRPLRYAPGTAKPLRNQPSSKCMKMCLPEKAVPRG